MVAEEQAERRKSLGLSQRKAGQLLDRAMICPPAFVLGKGSGACKTSELCRHSRISAAGASKCHEVAGFRLVGAGKCH